MERADAWPERLYSALLHCYPAEFRNEYALEMRAAFRERRKSEAAAGLFGTLRFAAAVCADTAITAAGEHASLLGRDLRYAWRMLRQTPSFTIAALTTLGLGIGAATAIFGLLYSTLLRPLPYADAGRVVRIWETNRKLDITSFSAATLNFLSWQERSRSFEGLAAIRSTNANIARDGEPERVQAASVSANLWRLLGIAPLAGRGFAAEEDQPGRDAVVMMSERLWLRRYSGSTEILGKTIPINGVQRTLIGVLPTDLGFSSATDVWMPLAPDPARENRGNHVVAVLGRLKHGVSVAQAEAELVQVAAGLEREFPRSNSGWSVRVAPVMQWIVLQETRTGLWVLLGAVAILLMAACSNVANLLVARAASRQREFGIRQALGAGRQRLLRQLVTESLLLAGLGTLLGIALAAAGLRGLAALLPANTPRIEGLGLSVPVLLFAVTLTFLTAALFGIAPAWMAGRTDVNTALKQSGRATAGGGRGGVRHALMAVQMALATVLVAGALLLLQSFYRLQAVALGFDPTHVLTARVSLPTAKYTSEEQAASFYRRLLDEIHGLPGVTSAGLASDAPLSGGDSVMYVAPLIPGGASSPTPVQASWRVVTSDFLQTLRIPLRRGRFFTDWEADRSKPAILSEGLARRLFPGGQDPIGRRIAVGDFRMEFTVTGVVGDVNQLSLSDGPRSTMYFPVSWSLADPMTLAVRSPVDPGRLAGAVRRSVQRIDPTQPLFAVRPMRELIDDSAAQPRLQSSLLAVFAGLALALGAIGVSGVVAYSVARRTPEIAIRMALGASSGRVVYEVTVAGLRFCLGGLAVGLAGAVLFARALSALLFQTGPYDALTFGATAAVLLASAVVACWLPGCRAARIQPATALRSE